MHVVLILELNHAFSEKAKFITIICSLAANLFFVKIEELETKLLYQSMN